MVDAPIKHIIEGALLAAGEPLPLQRLEALFEDGERPARDDIVAALAELEADCHQRSYELAQTASGYRFQVRENLARWVARLWEEKPKKYTRALLETLALIAYRQPVTRGDIEQVRGVAVSSDLVRTLMEREWVRVVGHRDVPGRPALFATTRQFLDYFNLASLDQLPPLAEIRDLSKLNIPLDFDDNFSAGKNRDEADSEQGESPMSDAAVQRGGSERSEDKAADAAVHSDATAVPPPNNIVTLPLARRSDYDDE